MLLRSLSILLFAAFAFYSCDAPRLNPLDPNNPDYISPVIDTVIIEPTYSLVGNVKTLAAPSSPIFSVDVYWPNENKLVKTDAAGNFSFDNIEKKDGWLYFEKNSYLNDSLFISWNDDTTVTVQKFLKYLPTVNYLSIYTEVLNSHSVPSYKIGFETEITDKDGLVDSVIIYNKDLKIYKSLPRQTFNRYGTNFKISELPLNSIEDAVGREFSLIFVDNQNNKITAAKEKLNRIIKQEIAFIAPINGEIVSSTPKMEWTRFTPGFPFHYLIQVYTDETGPVLVFEQDNIGSDQISFTLPTAINNEINGTDQYFWVIWCIDEFNNKSRSRQATFTVGE